MAGAPGRRQAASSSPGHRANPRASGHAQRQGAKLTGYAMKAGISWTLTRTWEDCDRDRERQLKNNRGAKYCPRCKAESVMLRDPAYRAAMDRARADFSKAIAAAAAERRGSPRQSPRTQAGNKAPHPGRAQRPPRPPPRP